MSAFNATIKIEEIKPVGELTEFMKKAKVPEEVLEFPVVPNATILIGDKRFMAHVSSYMDQPKEGNTFNAVLLLKKVELPDKSFTPFKVLNYFEVISVEATTGKVDSNQSIQLKGFLSNRYDRVKVNPRAAGVSLNFALLIKDIERKAHLTYCIATNDNARKLDKIFADKEANSKSVYIYLYGTFIMKKFGRVTFMVKDFTEPKSGEQLNLTKGE